MANFMIPNCPFHTWTIFDYTDTNVCMKKCSCILELMTDFRFKLYTIEYHIESNGFIINNYFVNYTRDRMLHKVTFV